jgi:hypothetical protein
MIVAFETKGSEVLNSFLDRYENPSSLTAQLSKNSFVEFSITRLNDLVIISQKHLYDVMAKWLLLLAITDLVVAYTYGNMLPFIIGGIFTFIGVLWLSPYFRYYALKLKISSKGHKNKILYVNNTEVIERLLLR